MPTSKLLNIEYDASTLRVKSRETTTREFKQLYDKKEVADYLRAIPTMTTAVQLRDISFEWKLLYCY